MSVVSLSCATELLGFAWMELKGISPTTVLVSLNMLFPDGFCILLLSCCGWGVDCSLFYIGFNEVFPWLGGGLNL